jgi:D-beta-D-heptose 7-phosphate kinase/D-beta-D-heptose 1-phosphate adenosyltransferase
MVKVLVFGETCIDKFIYGDVSRMSPEAPVPIFIPNETKENMGMSGNVVKNIETLSNVEVEHITNKKIITKTRLVDKKTNHMFIRIDEGEKDGIEILGELTDLYLDKIRQSDIVIVSDYNKGFLSDDNLKLISKESKISIIDSKRKLHEDTVKDFTFLKLNKSEYKKNQHINHNGLIVTLGDEGALFNGQIIEQENPQQTIDVSGAGDTFVSAFILKYFLTKNIIDSIRYANEVCCDVVNKKGVSLPDKKFSLYDQFSYISSTI